jgi:tetrahydromethanopterin S-methyltransferase subunit G
VEGKATEEQLRRAARNQSIFREVNERLEELAEKFQAVSETAPFSVNAPIWTAPA